MTKHARLEQQMEAEAHELDLRLEPACVDLLARFAALYFKWNEHINLGAVASAQELVERHFVDAFAATRFVRPRARVIDVGSGGGLPALPLALIRDDLAFDLFESVHKKGAFLRTAVRELGLADRVRVHVVTVESARDVGTPESSDAFDLAMSRATWEPVAWLALGRTLVRQDGGRVLVFTTSQAEPDLPPGDSSLTYGRNRKLLAFEVSSAASSV